MSILTRYLLLDLLKPTSVALFVMLSVIWLLQSLRFLDFIINRGLNVADFVLLTLLLIPSLLVILLPLAFFVGVTFALKRLQDDSESDALFTAGLSRLRILTPALFAAIIICAIGYLNAMWLLPIAKGHFKQIQFELRHNRGSLMLETGTFNAVSDNLTVYAKKRDKNGAMLDLLVHDARKPGKPITWVAERGQIVRNAGGYPQLLLDNAARLEINDNRLFILAFTKSMVDVDTPVETTEPRWRKAEERSMTELIHLPSGLSQRNKNLFRAELARRLLWPLTPIPLLFIAGLLVLPALKHRHGTLSRTVIASGLAVLYMAALTALQTLANKGALTVLYGQFSLPLITIVICVWLLRSNRTEGRLA